MKGMANYDFANFISLENLLILTNTDFDFPYITVISLAGDDKEKGSLRNNFVKQKHSHFLGKFEKKFHGLQQNY